jgi:hypothetical protein
VTLENGRAVVFVAIRAVSMNFDDFGNETPARASFKMNDDIHGVSYIRLDGEVRDIYTALQHATRESSKALLCGSGVYRRKTARVPCIQELQEVERLPGADFPDIRTGYACGWCELKDGVLTLVPHPDSGVETRTFRYASEVSVVGRVTAVTMSIEEERFAPLEEAKKGPTNPKK